MVGSTTGSKRRIGPKNAPPAPDDADLPGAWEGGNVRHTGGNIWCREYHNPDRELRVVYNWSNPGVGIERVTFDADGRAEFQEKGIHLAASNIPLNYRVALMALFLVEHTDGRILEFDGENDG